MIKVTVAVCSSLPVQIRAAQRRSPRRRAAEICSPMIELRISRVGNGRGTKARPGTLTKFEIRSDSAFDIATLRETQLLVPKFFLQGKNIPAEALRSLPLGKRRDFMKDQSEQLEEELIGKWDTSKPLPDQVYFLKVFKRNLGRLTL
ncbi:hypothetical protein DAPPUDRAFT_126083, partial [Daphnia pulex]